MCKIAGFLSSMYNAKNPVLALASECTSLLQVWAAKQLSKTRSTSRYDALSKPYLRTKDGNDLHDVTHTHSLHPMGTCGANQCRCRSNAIFILLYVELFDILRVVNGLVLPPQHPTPSH
jgi:hypothetical protein